MVTILALTSMLGISVGLEGAAVKGLLLRHGRCLLRQLKPALRSTIGLLVFDDVFWHVLLQMLLRLRQGPRIVLLGVSSSSVVLTWLPICIVWSLLAFDLP